MLNLNKLTKDLSFDNIDEVIGGRAIYTNTIALKCGNNYTSSSSSCSSSSGNCGGDDNTGGTADNNGNSGD